MTIRITSSREYTERKWRLPGETINEVNGFIGFGRFPIGQYDCAGGLVCLKAGEKNECIANNNGCIIDGCIDYTIDSKHPNVLIVGNSVNTARITDNLHSQLVYQSDELHLFDYRHVDAGMSSSDIVAVLQDVHANMMRRLDFIADSDVSDYMDVPESVRAVDDAYHGLEQFLMLKDYDGIVGNADMTADEKRILKSTVAAMLRIGSRAGLHVIIVTSMIDDVISMDSMKNLQVRVTAGEVSLQTSSAVIHNRAAGVVDDDYTGIITAIDDTACIVFRLDTSGRADG